MTTKRLIALMLTLVLLGGMLPAAYAQGGNFETEVLLQVVTPENTIDSEMALGTFDLSTLKSGQYVSPCIKITNKSSQSQAVNFSCTIDGDGWKWTEHTLEAGQSLRFDFSQAKAEKYYCNGSHTITIRINGETIETCTWSIAGEKPAPTPTPNPNVGRYVTFGSYPQTTDGTDSTPIEWLVLDVDEAAGKALLISRYGLDRVRYNNKYSSVTWKTCSLRTWLNKTFLGKAFTAAEQAYILTTEVDNSQSQCSSEWWNISGGEDTKDKLFLLSYAEAQKYFASDDARRCAPTDYAATQGAYVGFVKVDGRGAGVWWLRSPGSTNFFAAGVINVGSLGYDGKVDDGYHVVRPAMWVKLSSGIF